MNNKNKELNEITEKTGDLVWVLLVFFVLTMFFSFIWGELIDILVESERNQVVHKSTKQCE